MDKGYITIEDACQELGVTRSTMYYYRKQLDIEYKKFPLDKRKYLAPDDFSRIKEAKQAAVDRKH